MNERSNGRTAPSRTSVFDLIGVGFGPSNLALALAIEEESEVVGKRPLSSLFLERRGDCCWHPGMLLDGAQVQISFLKDLVTLRNPRSRFTFLNFLKEQDRLAEFVNLRTFFPSRLELNQYFQWIAAQLDEQVRYGVEVRRIRPVVARDGRVRALRVLGKDTHGGGSVELCGRNLVIATGGVPWQPVSVPTSLSRQVMHSSEFLLRIHRDFPDAQASYRFLVVGSGQSAAEIFQYLYSSFPNSRVTAALRRFAYKPADESEFVNEIFSPDNVDLFYELAPEDRSELIAAHYDTNYSAVDLELIRALYRSLYERRVAGDDRLAVRSQLELCDLQPGFTGVVATFRDKRRAGLPKLEVDGVILATGFTRPGRHPLLEELEPYLLPSGPDRFQIGRDYRLQGTPELEAGIYLQGFCEQTHGLSDTLLSVLAVRAHEILLSLLGQGLAAELSAQPFEPRAALKPFEGELLAAAAGTER